MKNNISSEDLQLRKQVLKARLNMIEAQFRQDLQELREDLNPTRQLVNMAKRVLAPRPMFSAAQSGLTNMAINTGINTVGNMLLPGWKWRIARMAAPLVQRQLKEMEVGAKVKNGLIDALEWVAEKTADTPALSTPVKPEQENAT